MIGSSQVYQINATKINEKLQLTNEEYVVYNFGMHGTFLESFIDNHGLELSPDIILYGISYRDFFVDVKNKDNFLDINNLFSNIILEIKPDLSSKNPKATTLQTIRKLIGNKEFFPDPIDNLIYIYGDDIIRTQVSYSEANFYKITNYEKNPNVKKLEDIIEISKEKEIKIILFHPPFHKYYLNLIPDESKQNFKMIMDKISDKYNVKIYDLHGNYADLDIWADLVHVAYHPDAMIYTDDVAEIILQEIKQ